MSTDSLAELAELVGFGLICAGVYALAGLAWCLIASGTAVALVAAQIGSSE